MYCTEGFVLSPLREVLCGPLNDVVICQNLASPIAARYTLWVVKSRECVKRLLNLFENARRGEELPYLCRFAQNDQMIFVFDYRPERRLSAFGGGQLRSDFMRESACIHLVMECLSSPLPYPLLCLLLEQDNVNLEKDNTVFFTYFLDLSQLDDSDGEAVCANRCASIALSTFGGASKLKSAKLLRKKQANAAYCKLTELYRDIKLTSIPEVKQGFRHRLRAFWLQNRDWLFKVLLAASAVVIAFTLIVLISQLILGSVPLFRIFEHSFDVIGTETLR